MNHYHGDAISLLNEIKDGLAERYERAEIDAVIELIEYGSNLDNGNHNETNQ